MKKTSAMIMDVTMSTSGGFRQMLLLRKKSPGYATVCVCVHALCAGRHDAIAAAAAAGGGGGGACAGSGGGAGGSSSANSAVPTSMLLAVSLLYVALSACSTVSYLVARLAGPSAGGGGGGEVPAWCVRALRPRLRVADRVYSIASQLHKLVFAYNFVVYVLTGRQFRAELRQMVSRPALVRRIFTSRQTSQQSADTAL